VMMSVSIDHAAQLIASGLVSDPSRCRSLRSACRAHVQLTTPRNSITDLDPPAHVLIDAQVGGPLRRANPNPFAHAATQVAKLKQPSVNL